MSARLVLHADMDAFYASIEVRDRPELRGKPVIVGATSARGVVAAASYEARRFGVRSAMPGFRAKELCPNGVFLPSDMARYARVSNEVHEIFERFSPEVEPIALDEAFLDITGSVSLFGGPLALGRLLKAEVRRLVGLPISVGIGPSKLVAKLACTLSKPDGFLYVPPDAVTWLLHPLPVRRLWGVGPVMEQTLVDRGFQTIGDLARADVSLIASAVGDRAASLKRLALGEDDRDVESALAPKSYGEENTFERDVTDRDVVTAALTAHSEAVARRLRHDGFQGRTVTVKLKLGKPRGHRTSRTDSGVREPIYPLLTRSRTLPQPTSDGKRIRDVAVALWDAAKIGEPVRLLGVSLSNLTGGDMEQLDLFGTRATTDRLGPALDAITTRFGKGAIRRAVDEPEKATASDRRKRGE
ncbi:MAG TPA: DNA polymerase IV [Polyangiaceae bacterium]|jgi:DNA polymerase-4|nr:DNA polymerase IV [Polyangiaceae bacterium]